MVDADMACDELQQDLARAGAVVEAAKSWRAARVAVLKAYAEDSKATLEERTALYTELGRAEWALSDAVKELT